MNLDSVLRKIKYITVDVVWYLPDKVEQHSDGDVGVDFYTRYKVCHCLQWV